jgi:hypothetical protein
MWNRGIHRVGRLEGKPGSAFGSSREAASGRASTVANAASVVVAAARFLHVVLSLPQRENMIQLRLHHL